MERLLICLLIPILCCCNRSYDEESLIEDILENESDRVIDEMYKYWEMDQEAFKEVMAQYSRKIEASNLNRVEFIEDKLFSSDSREREGYMFVDENNNIVYSITYKFVTLSETKRKVNFIDFRSSEEDLPCIKFPTKFPIKCLIIPKTLPIDPDSITQVFPKEIGGYTFYHSQSNLNRLEELQGDSAKTIMLFNFGNKKIENNIAEMLSNMETSQSPAHFVLALNHQYGTPSTNIHFDPELVDRTLISKIKTAIESALDEKVNLYQKNLGHKFAITIGFGHSEARVKLQ